MILIDQLEMLIDQARAGGRVPLMVRVLPEKLSILEADAEARQVLGRGTIFGIPYEPHLNPNGQGVVLTYRDALPE